MGKETIDESTNEIKKMQYRIKDFQQLYNISENKFYPNIENINIRKCLEELVDLLKIDLKGKFMEINLEIDPAVPENIQADLNKLRQVILNLFYQSVQGQIKGFIKFVVVYKEEVTNEPYVQVDIENSKFVVKARDAQRLNKLSQETSFEKILEANVEMNHKIAKIIANAMGWKLDFNAFTNGKQTMIIPVKINKPQPPPEEEKERNENDLFNEIEGNRADVHLAPISEEIPGATGQTNTDEKPDFKPPENYPLRQP